MSSQTLVRLLLDRCGVRNVLNQLFTALSKTMLLSIEWYTFSSIKKRNFMIRALKTTMALLYTNCNLLFHWNHFFFAIWIIAIYVFCVTFKQFFFVTYKFLTTFETNVCASDKIANRMYLCEFFPSFVLPATKKNRRNVWKCDNIYDSIQ